MRATRCRALYKLAMWSALPPAQMCCFWCSEVMQCQTIMNMDSWVATASKDDDLPVFGALPSARPPADEANGQHRESPKSPRSPPSRLYSCLLCLWSAGVAMCCMSIPEPDLHEVVEALDSPCAQPLPSFGPGPPRPWSPGRPYSGSWNCLGFCQSLLISNIFEYCVICRQPAGTG